MESTYSAIKFSPASPPDLGKSPRESAALQQNRVYGSDRGEKKMSSENRPIRVLIAKTALDGHWRGVYVVAKALCDAGMEVIYGGDLNPYQIVETTIQEGVDVLGLNIGGRYHQIRIVMEQLKKKGADEILVIAGGHVPPEDIPLLKEIGIAEVFPPGSSLEAIVKFTKENIKPKGLTK
jgi:methylmalonyl-CoA mutase C-terminal domain/subunit